MTNLIFSHAKKDVRIVNVMTFLKIKNNRKETKNQAQIYFSIHALNFKFFSPMSYIKLFFPHHRHEAKRPFISIQG